MKVSVCLATYNGERFIKQQLESILNQLSGDDELIISDDGSSDQTIPIINSFGDSRIKLFENDNKKDIARNFENALKKASGDYIFLSDQDDIWCENKLLLVCKELESSDCVLHNAQVIDSNNNYLNLDLFSIYKTRKGYLNNLIRNTFVGCCMAFKKELLPVILPIPSSIKMHDMWIALIAEKKGKTKLLNSNLILYRRHQNNASTTSNKSSYSRIYQLKYRLQMLFHTILR